MERPDAFHKLFEDRLELSGSALRGIVTEMLAADQFHGEEPAALVGDQLVQCREIGMIDIGQRPEFLLEALQAGSVGIPQGLQRDRAVKVPIVSLIYDAEAALAQTTADGITRAAFELDIAEGCRHTLNSTGK